MAATKKLHPDHYYAAIEHRVIDSDAFFDISNSACRLLILIARQLTVNATWPKGNNGHLTAAFKECKKRGFGSEHTLRDAIAELISHGFIYRTRSHGANGAWAHYAVTWLPIKEAKGLFLDGFVTCAWRNWTAPNKKSTRQKVPEQSGRKCSFTPENPAESAGKLPAETAPYVVITNTEVLSGALSGVRGGSPLRLKKLAVLEHLFTVGVQKTIQRQNHRWTH
jgi:hypothetical protein